VSKRDRNKEVDVRVNCIRSSDSATCDVYVYPVAYCANFRTVQLSET